MLLSRRNFIRTLGVSAAAGAATQLPLSAASLQPWFESTRARKPGGPVRLDANENVYGPSPKVVAAMREALSSANRYPFHELDALVSRIAALHRVSPGQVLLGCGSSEILRITAVGFLGPGKKLVQASPTFEESAAYARSVGADVAAVPLNREYAHDIDAMLAHTDASTNLAYICNANNPTASITPRPDIERFIAQSPANTYIVIDEAYFHYADESVRAASFLERPVHDDRVIVSRTFSKVYGMAGMRLGYAIAAPKTAARLRPYLSFDNVNIVVARAAMAALDDVDGVREFARRNADDRQEFFNQAQARMVKPIHSHANFFMMDTHMPAEAVIEHFKKNNVLIGRKFSPMDTFVRVSLGKPDDKNEFWRVWDLLPKTGKMDM